MAFSTARPQAKLTGDTADVNSSMSLVLPAPASPSTRVSDPLPELAPAKARVR